MNAHSNLSEEEQVQLALRDSAKSVAQEQVLNSVYLKPRNELPSRLDKHRAHFREAINGTVIQFNGLNQFGSLFDGLKDRHTTASAICGYLTCATVLLLEHMIDGLASELTITDVYKFVNNTLCNIEELKDPVGQCMQFIQDSRHAYWASNGKQCADAVDLRQWVANYEIGDYLKSFSSQNTTCFSREKTAFVRYNQWPCRGEATPDEFKRLAEEKRFGGIENAASREVTYADKDSVFFIECFTERNQSVWYEPEQWAEQKSSRPRVLAIDLQGHFVAALSCCFDDEKYLFVFNTTSSDYISVSPAIAWTFDSMLPLP